MRLDQKRLVAAFFGLTLVAGWAPFAYLILAERDASPGQIGAALAWFHFPPLLAALLLTGPVLKQPIRPALGITFGVNRFWGPAWLSPMLVLLVGLGFAWLLSGVEPILTTARYLAWKRSVLAPDAFERMVTENPPGHPLYLIVRGLPASLTLNLLLGLGMETGFRGFLFREMPGGFWARSLRIGALFGVYLAPLGWIHFRDTPLEGVGFVALVALALSPSLVYLRVRAGSVIPIALFWSMVLTLTRPALDLSGEIPAWARPFFGLGGLLAALALLGALYLHDRFAAEQRLMPERSRLRSGGTPE